MMFLAAVPAEECRVKSSLWRARIIRLAIQCDQPFTGAVQRCMDMACASDELMQFECHKGPATGPTPRIGRQAHDR